MDRRSFFEVSGAAAAAYGLASVLGNHSRAMAAPNGQVVLITGAATGFGNRMALTFARAGYTVYATMREPQSGGRHSAKAAELLQKAQVENLDLKVEKLDTTSQAQAAAIVKKIIDTQGRIDILVNSAGSLVYMPVEIAPREVWDFQMKVNVYGPMELAGLILPHMRNQRSGLIVNVSSRVGRVIIPGIGMYATSKFALETATEAAHYETTPQGIDFALIQPSAFDTDVNRNARKIYRDFTLPLLEEKRPDGRQHYRDFLSTLDNNFAGQPTRNPQEVADLALAIARTPRERRVLRYPVGDDFELGPVKDLNGKIASIQQKALNDSGYGYLYRD